MRSAVLALVLLAGSARAAHADDAEISEAMRLEAQLEYDKALPIVEHVIAEGHADRDRLIGLHMMAGRLAAGLDREDVAQDHFARALALDPARTLPEGTSPKITAPLEAARAKTKPLQLSSKMIDGHLELVVGADELHLVARHETVVTRTGEELRAYDEHDNVLWSERLDNRPPVPRERSVAPHVPLYRRGVLWASVAGTGLIVAGVGALEFRSKQHAWNNLRADDGNHDYSELRSLEDSAHHWAYATYAGLGVAAVGIVAAAILVPKGDPAPIVYTSEHTISVGAVGRF